MRAYGVPRAGAVHHSSLGGLQVSGGRRLFHFSPLLAPPAPPLATIAVNCVAVLRLTLSKRAGALVCAQRNGSIRISGDRDSHWPPRIFSAPSPIIAIFSLHGMAPNQELARVSIFGAAWGWRGESCRFQ